MATERLRGLPLHEPAQVEGDSQWYYRTKDSIWVLRVTDDNRKRSAKMPCWVFLEWNDYDSQQH